MENKNRHLHYLGTSDGADYLHLDPLTGDVTLLKPLDRETKVPISLEIEANDNGTPPRKVSMRGSLLNPTKLRRLYRVNFFTTTNILRCSL